METSVHVIGLNVYFIIESIHAVLKLFTIIRDPPPKKSTTCTHTQIKFHKQKNPDMFVCVLP